MTKKSFIINLVLTVALISCGSSKGKLDKIGGPSWIFDPYSVSKSKNEVAAVGIADPSKGGIKIQIAQAEADAVGNIASQIQTKIDKVVEDAMSKKENVVASSAPGSKVNGSAEDVEKSFSSVTRAVVEKLSVVGARRTDIYQDPKTDTLYVRMVVDVDRVQELFRKSIGMYQELASKGVDKKTIDKLTRDILGAKFDQTDMVLAGVNTAASAEPTAEVAAK